AIYLGLLVLAGGVFAIAWWALRKARPHARRWAIAASLLNLPLIPVGRLLGLAGLVVFSRQEIATVFSSQRRLHASGATKPAKSAISSRRSAGQIDRARHRAHHYCRVTFPL